MTNIYSTKRDRVLEFSNPLEYADYLEAIPAHLRYPDSINTAGESWDRALHYLRNGSLAMAGHAEKIMEQLQNERVLSIGLPQPSYSVTGALAVYPLWAAGVPNCMLTRDPSELKGTNTPLNIYYDRFGSIGLNHKELTNRGLAALGFVMAMASIRPINLYAIAASCPNNNNGLYGAVIRIPTQPLDLARAAWMLTSTGFTRRLTWTSASYQSNISLGCPGADPRSLIGPFKLYCAPSTPSYDLSMKQSCRASKEDIVLHGAYLFDRLMLTDPVAWIKRMIKEHTEWVNTP